MVVPWRLVRLGYETQQLRVGHAYGSLAGANQHGKVPTQALAEIDGSKFIDTPRAEEGPHVDRTILAPWAFLFKVIESEKGIARAAETLAVAVRHGGHRRKSEGPRPK